MLKLEEFKSVKANFLNNVKGGLKTEGGEMCMTDRVCKVWTSDTYVYSNGLYPGETIYHGVTFRTASCYQ